MSFDVVSPEKLASALGEHWSPRVIAEVDDAYVKVAKVQGTLAWHSHDDEDEFFYVLAGTLRIEMEDRTSSSTPATRSSCPRACATTRLPNASVSSC